MPVKVRAIKKGYYKHEIFEEGRVFEMDESALYRKGKDKKVLLDEETGKPVLPRWIELASEPPKEPKKYPTPQDGKNSRGKTSDDESVI